MRLHRLGLKDKWFFDKFLKLTVHELSVYAFENIYIWKGLFDIYWTIIDDNLCVFFKDKIGSFMYMPPLGRQIKPWIIEETFGIMDRFNKNKEISCIENVEAKMLGFYQDLGYECIDKPGDYLCNRIDLVKLGGNKFKSQRACVNYFIKHYQFDYLFFSSRYKNDCLRLYELWSQGRKSKIKDTVYQGMLRDSRNCLRVLLNNYGNLDFIGRMVRIDGKIKAFTFGFRLNPETFCILYEITDLSIKGLAQFIFQQFCSELKDYKYINIMDDSGLENLRKVKLSYHPVRFISSYIIRRKNNA